MPTRKWRLDYAWPLNRLAIELQGGIYGNRTGGHTSTKGVMRDMQKLNTAQLLDWDVLYLARHDLLKKNLDQTRRLVVFMLLRSILDSSQDRFMELCINHGISNQ